MAATLFEELSNPNLSRQEFFQKAKDYNTAHKNEVAKGSYDDITFYPFSGRKVRVKMFTKGHISFSVYDRHTKGRNGKGK